MPSASDHHLLLSRLRDEIRRIERRPARRGGALPCGVAAVDALLPGGFPCGALAELRGGPASGKTAVALGAVAGLPRGALAAWVDGRRELYPPAAAALGVDLSRLLIVRPPGGEEGGRLALWAAEVLLGSGAFAAVALDIPLARGWRGLEPALRRLVTAAEQGGAAGLWLSPAGGSVSGTVRPPASLRLDLRTDGRRLVVARADGAGLAGCGAEGRGAEQRGAEARAPAAALRRAGGVHAA